MVYSSGLVNQVPALFLLGSVSFHGYVNTYYFVPSLNESKSCKIYQWPGKDQKVTKHLNFVSNYPVTMNYLHERKRKLKIIYQINHRFKHNNLVIGQAAALSC